MPKYNEHSVDSGIAESLDWLESVIETCNGMQELTKYWEIEVSPTSQPNF